VSPCDSKAGRCCEESGRGRPWVGLHSTPTRPDFPERVAALVASFGGGGILLAALALELVPGADRDAGAGLTTLELGTGTRIYVGGDACLSPGEEMTSMRRSESTRWASPWTACLSNPSPSLIGSAEAVAA
jgi:hypothetical protein